MNHRDAENEEEVRIEIMSTPAEGGLTEEEKLKLMRPDAARMPATLAHIDLLHAMLAAKTKADALCLLSMNPGRWSDVFNVAMEKQGYVAFTAMRPVEIQALRHIEAEKRYVCAWSPDPRRNPEVENYPVFPILWVKREQAGELKIVASGRAQYLENEKGEGNASIAKDDGGTTVGKAAATGGRGGCEDD